jgi:hypothetical protein
VKVVVAPALVAMLAVSSSAFASGPSITVTPATVHAGQRVTLSGNAGGCPAGDRVTLISHAFSHRHEFAGVPAIFASVSANGHYRASTLIPSGRRDGRYTITGRCGGGSFGVTARLRVLRP